MGIEMGIEREQQIRKKMGKERESARVCKAVSWEKFKKNWENWLFK